MRTIKKMMTIVVMLTICTSQVLCVDNAFSGNRGNLQGPPPEAYVACEGKNAGDEAQFVDPRGETVTGTCELVGDRLVLRPSNAGGRSGNRLRGAPPEAYAACEGKSVGDTAEFESPQGDTVTGSCEQEGDRLVLRPDHPSGGRGMNGAND